MGEAAGKAADASKQIFGESSVEYKAFAITQAGIATYLAATKALAEVPVPFNFVEAGLITAMGLANVAKIAGFANGGIVGGSSYSGDKVPIRVNSGEMILNGAQQAKLFSTINNGSTANGKNSIVEFKIKGDTLVGVLNNHSHKISRTR